MNSDNEDDFRVWIYGGVHDDPGSRRNLLSALNPRRNPPFAVAVEWDEHVFEALNAARITVAEKVRDQCQWEFLTERDPSTLAGALAWEGDALLEKFPGTRRIWLEERYQEQVLAGVSCRANELVNQIKNARRPSLREFRTTNIVPTPIYMSPEPNSLDALIDRVMTKKWDDRDSDSPFERDERWSQILFKELSSTSAGWIAVVVGWTHANPANSGRLFDRLRLAGVKVRAWRLGPPGYEGPVP